MCTAYRNFVVIFFNIYGSFDTYNISTHTEYIEMSVYSSHIVVKRRFVNYFIFFGCHIKQTNEKRVKIRSLYTKLSMKHSHFGVVCVEPSFLRLFLSLFVSFFLYFPFIRTLLRYI